MSQDEGFAERPGDISYVWKTQKSWAGTCRQFTLRLADGADHIALFKFK